MVADISPKETKGLKYIGYKGLGFRSILGWASSIAILSGKASWGFGKSSAIKWLSKLKSQSQKITDRLNQHFDKTGIKDPIAVLDVPIPLDEKVIDKNLLTLEKEGGLFLEKGFDTVICLGFSSPKKTYPLVEKQINSLGSETLLFLNHIISMEINTPAKETKRWRVERDKTVIMVSTSDDKSQIWDLFMDEGEIPDKYLSVEKKINNKYEIKIAIPTTHESSINRLYTYFPTKVSFPFPVVAHATFELTSNRQNLIDSEANKYVAKRLAKLMAESAEKVKKINEPWYALTSFTPYSDTHPDLEVIGFVDCLKEYLQIASIVPTINGKFMPSLDVKQAKGNFDNLLKGALFDDICLFPPNDKLLNKLDIEYIDYDDLKARINRITKQLPLESRAELIFLLCKNYKHVSDEAPELFLDTEGEVMQKDLIPVLPPEDKVFSLPVWVRYRIIKSDLLGLLKYHFNVSRNRDLTTELKIFNVQEYNLRTLVSAIVSGARKRTEEVR